MVTNDYNCDRHNAVLGEPQAVLSIDDLVCGTVYDSKNIASAIQQNCLTSPKK
jgi:hypothetical protein